MIVPRQKAIDAFNRLGSGRTPFFFITDFLGGEAFLQTLDQIDDDVKFRFGENGIGEKSEAHTLIPKPVDFQSFLSAFESIKHEISIGNSFLTNLTFLTPVESQQSLLDIYQESVAKYKVYFKDQFVCFSPETFVKISEEGKISSFPMKGTIAADVPNAKKTLLQDPKEIAEHVTIVDLIRNDLSQVAHQVHVPKFRYIEKVNTNHKSLLQASSEVKGQLNSRWKEQLGDTLFQLLPAGSITGAPKPETVNIILRNETYERGYYTGICGYFDGEKLDSGVMIRFIENIDGQLYYKSGAGITAFSDPEKEYQEILDKIYVPVH